MQILLTLRISVWTRTRPSSVCQTERNHSGCEYKKECTVYWPQFCGSVVFNFMARFLSALIVIDETSTREQGHLAAEPRSAPLSWQAWWMQAEEHAIVQLQFLQPPCVGQKQEKGFASCSVNLDRKLWFSLHLACCLVLVIYESFETLKS